MNSFLSDMQRRGLVHDMSAPSHKDWPTLDARLDERPITAYVGIDPTSDSMHIGHLLQLLALIRLQRAGHTPIAVVGGGTGLIGDPSFKASERKMLSVEHVEANVAGLRAQLEQFLDFSEDRPNRAVLLNNAEWLCKARLVEFLRDIGKHFSVGQMVARDSVKQRLEGREHGISFTEFSYALMQAYDFLTLFDTHGCELQIGGSDQWGNILDGMDLIRRLRQKPSWGFTQPLITKADGSKFGKTESGTVWIDPEKTSPFLFFQFWLNCSDRDVGNYLRYFTFLEIEAIEALEAELAKTPQERAAQNALADEMTRFVHGQAALDGAKRATAVLFQGGDFRSLSEQELRAAFQDTPRITLDRATLGSPDAGLPALVATSGLESSRGRARKAIDSGAISVNGVAERDATRVIGADDLLPGGFLVLRRGKKTYHVVEFDERV